jgi:hypothetical protein
MDDLLTRHTVAQVLGAARLKRLVRAGWLRPVEHTPQRVLFSVHDVHAALRRLERGEVCPPDQVESERTNGSAIRHGRGYVAKGRKARTPVWDLNLDFSAVTGSDL